MLFEAGKWMDPFNVLGALMIYCIGRVFSMDDKDTNPDLKTKDGRCLM